MNFFEDVKDQVAAFIRSWALLFYIILGFMGQLGWKIIQGKTPSIWQTIGYALIACFIGFVSYNFCPEEKRAWVVPIATLLSDKIIMILTNIKADDIKRFFLKMLGK
jgi:hypothetical protein